MASEDRRKQLRSALIDLLCAAAGPDRLVLPADLVAGGIPRQFAAAISAASRGLMSDVDAVEVADEWATRIDEAVGELDDVTDPRQLASHVPRY